MCHPQVNDFIVFLCLYQRNVAGYLGISEDSVWACEQRDRGRDYLDTAAKSSQLWLDAEIRKVEKMFKFMSTGVELVAEGIVIPQNILIQTNCHPAYPFVVFSVWIHC